MRSRSGGSRCSRRSRPASDARDQRSLRVRAGARVRHRVQSSRSSTVAIGDPTATPIDAASAPPARTSRRVVPVSNGLEFCGSTPRARSTVTIADFDGNGVNDIGYTERVAGHQRMMIAYGTADRPLAPVEVATFSDVASVTPVEIPDSVDTLNIATDLAVIQPGAPSTISLLHGSPQRTMLSFFDPRANQFRDTTLRGSVVGEFVGADRPDLLILGTRPTARAFRPAPPPASIPRASTGAVSGLADCLTGSGTGVCRRRAVRRVADGAAPHRDRDRSRVAATADARSTGQRELARDDLRRRSPGCVTGTSIRSLPRGQPRRRRRSELVVVRDAQRTPAGKVVVRRVDNGVPASYEHLARSPRSPGVGASTPRPPHRRRGHTRRGLAARRAVRRRRRVVDLPRHEGQRVPRPALAHGTGLHAIRIGITGDGVDDVVVQGDGGARRSSCSRSAHPQPVGRQVASRHRRRRSGSFRLRDRRDPTRVPTTAPKPELLRRRERPTPRRACGRRRELRRGTRRCRPRIAFSAAAGVSPSVPAQPNRSTSSARSICGSTSTR